MSALVLPIFVGIFISIIVAVLFVILGAIYSRGEVVYVYLDKIAPYFPKIKRSKRMRLKLDRELVQSLTPEIQSLLDGLFFDKTKDGKVKIEDDKLIVNSGVPKDLVESWMKIRENPSKFQVWCYRFSRGWNVKHLGVKGRTVYSFCFFSLEEMVKKRGRHRTLDGFFSDEYLLAHDPSLEQFVQKQVEEASLRGESLTPMQLKELKKSYKYRRDETYLVNLFVPTALHVNEKAELMERFSGFGDVFRIGMYALNVLGQLPKLELLKATTRNMLKTQRKMKQTLHSQRDIVGQKTSEIGNLTDQLKQSTVPVTLSPKHESFPTIPSMPAKESTVGDFKKKLESTNTGDLVFWFIVAIAIIFGLAFTVFGVASLVAGGATGLYIALIGVLFLVVFFVAFFLKKRFEGPPLMKIPKPGEVKQPEE